MRKLALATAALGLAFAGINGWIMATGSISGVSADKTIVATMDTIVSPGSQDMNPIVPYDETNRPEIVGDQSAGN
jgi:hypothetical protein